MSRGGQEQGEGNKTSRSHTLAFPSVPPTEWFYMSFPHTRTAPSPRKHLTHQHDTQMCTCVDEGGREKQTSVSSYL